MPENRFWRDASKRLTFEISQIPAGSYSELCNKISTALSLSRVDGSFVHGLDVVFQDFRQGERSVQFAWDNWTGFTITSLTPDSESLVQEIADWLLQDQMFKLLE